MKSRTIVLLILACTLVLANLAAVVWFFTGDYAAELELYELRKAEYPGIPGAGVDGLLLKAYPQAELRPDESGITWANTLKGYTVIGSMVRSEWVRYPVAVTLDGVPEDSTIHAVSFDELVGDITWSTVFLHSDGCIDKMIVFDDVKPLRTISTNCFATGYPLVDGVIRRIHEEFPSEE